MTYGKLEGFLLPKKGEIVIYEMKCLAMVYDVKNNWKPPYKYKKKVRGDHQRQLLYYALPWGPSLNPASVCLSSSFLVFNQKKVILNFPTVKL